MVAPLLSLALSLSLFTRADTSDAAKEVVHRALLAVEGDSIAPVRARWSARLERDSADREAVLHRQPRPAIEPHSAWRMNSLATTCSST